MRKATARKLLKEELRKTPIISVACKRVGVSRQSFYRWNAADEKFMNEMLTAMKDGIRYINDLTESQLLKLIQEGKFSAVRYWLDRRHPLYKRKTSKEKSDEKKEKWQHVQRIEIKEYGTGRILESTDVPITRNTQD